MVLAWRLCWLLLDGDCERGYGKLTLLIQLIQIVALMAFLAILTGAGFAIGMYLIALKMESYKQEMTRHEMDEMSEPKWR